MRMLVVSGSRADYGGLEALNKELQNCKIESVLSYIPFDFSGLPKLFDLVAVLGDRFEILRAVVELYVVGLPIAHLSGGDITEGSADDCMRHAITKLSHLHFVTNEISAQRVIQMGEEPWRVHNVGYPGADNPPIIDLEDAKRRAGILSYPSDFILVVWHPNTIESSSNQLEVMDLTNALDRIFKKTLIIGPNSDSGNIEVRDHMKRWCERTYNVYCENLPRDVYLTLLKNCACLVGNSSSGHYEAPLFGTPVVDIGDRQMGRAVSANTVRVPVNVAKIVTAINELYGRKFPIIQQQNAAKRIADVICKIEDPKSLLRKKWHSLRVD